MSSVAQPSCSARGATCRRQSASPAPDRPPSPAARRPAAPRRRWKPPGRSVHPTLWRPARPGACAGAVPRPGTATAFVRCARKQLSSLSGKCQRGGFDEVISGACRRIETLRRSGAPRPSAPGRSACEHDRRVCGPDLSDSTTRSCVHPVVPARDEPCDQLDGGGRNAGAEEVGRRAGAHDGRADRRAGSTLSAAAATP